MLHHVAPPPAQDRAFAELARVLVPGGVLVAADGVHMRGTVAFHEGDTYNPIDPEDLVGRLATARLRRRRGAHPRPRLGVHGSTWPDRSGGGSAVTILFALAAAFSNALNMVTQHLASISDPGHSKGWRFVRYLVSNPLWLFGWVALAGSFVFQALALHNGQMSVVQPLLVTELVFALVLRRLWIHQQIRDITWWAAAVTCGSLALFVAMSEPTGGHAQPTSSAWIGASAATGGAAAILALIGMRGSPVRRAAALGAATSMLWALVATFIKAMTDTLTQFGLVGMFTHWPVYALIVVSIMAEFLDQTALHVGPLSISQPLIVIVDPIVSIALSVWIFAEVFTEDPFRLAVGAAAFAAMCAATVVLARTVPATMDPRARSGSTTRRLRADLVTVSRESPSCRPSRSECSMSWRSGCGGPGGGEVRARGTSWPGGGRW